MQATAIKCKVNAAEAIRRGFNVTSEVVLNVDVSELSEARRSQLAQKVTKVGDTLAFSAEIDSPDIAGFEAALDRGIAREEEYRLADERTEANHMVKVERDFAERKVTTQRRSVWAFEKDGEVRFSDSWCAAPGRHAEYERRNPECGVFLRSSAQARFRELMASPEGVAWQRQLDESNAQAEEGARLRAVQALKERKEKLRVAEERKKKRLEELRAWVEKEGPVRVRLLLELDYPWEEAATDAYCRARVTAWGCGSSIVVPSSDESVEDLDDMEPTEAALESLKELREIAGEDADVDLVRIGDIQFLRVQVFGPGDGGFVYCEIPE